jgi:SAM-dependent methyltransferase
VSTYLFDHGWLDERRRLEGLQQVLDSSTFRHLAATGVGSGWRCLEVGGGAGSVAEWLCERVDGHGSVVVTDLDTGFLDKLGLPNLEVRRHDIVADDLEEGAFDLIHSRLVLEHLRGRDAALARMAKALVPGGWLVVEDFDWTPVTVLSARPDRHVQRVSRMLPAVLRLAVGLMGAAGYDPHFGGRLPAELARLGLVDVTAEGRAVHIRGGSPEADFGRLTVTRFRDLIEHPPEAVGDGRPWTVPGALRRSESLRRVALRAIDELTALLDDPAVFCRAPLLVTAMGRRPSAIP